MERYELLLSLAAIIFGGGMLGRLIEFFVKRRDDQNSKKMALYKRLYDKLCDYNTLLLSSVMDFITYIESTKLEIDDNSNAIKEKMSEIKTLIEDVRAYQQNCKKKGCNKRTCEICTRKWGQLKKLDQQINQDILANEKLILNIEEYWKKHSNDIYKRISGFINLHHIMCLIGYKENKLFTHIAKIDKQSLILSQILMGTRGFDKSLQSAIFAQIKNIEHCLILLSKMIR